VYVDDQPERVTAMLNWQGESGSLKKSF